jgi:subfamily B ATP-binding cassette protein HlyB/CyaB
MLNPNLLCRHPIFNLLDRNQLALLAESAQMRRMATGELLCREHEKAHSLFVVKSGRVRVLRKSEDDREITVGTCKAGELIGDYSLLEPHRTAATCRVSESAEIWSLPLAPALTLLRTALGNVSLRPWLKLQYLVRFLRNESYLGFMSGGSFLPLLDDCQQLSFETGETIQAEGLFADSMFVVTSGTVRRKELSSGNRIATAQGTSDLFGVEAFLNGIDVPCVIAETAADCWRIPRQNLFGGSNADGTLQSLGQPKKALSLHFPFVKQQSATECGCAALAMLAKFHRLPVTMDSVRESVLLDHRGASLADLQRAAEQLGFKARAVRIGDANLTGATLPAIAHLQGDHYVAIFDANADAVIVGDPAVGVVRHSRQQFRQIWDGTLLLLQPSAGR